jgi:uncharacterized protein DUF6519/parallel beta helix pectate lyase-like protein
MSGDYSRNTFDPRRDFAGVFMQQGRVQLDADWNEQVEIIARRLQAGSLDTFGPAVVPKDDAGFEIVAGGGAITIGRGRLYADGLLAENHGIGNAEWDKRLAEERGTVPVSYSEQPFYLNPPALPGAGQQHLFYLDVWDREISYVERPSLVDNAIGVDTTTRRQRVWQVKFLSNVGDIKKDTPEADIPGWTDATRSSSGRLTTSYVPVVVDPNPCAPQPTGGYRGLENQLYRVEIHDGGVPGTATFKWSRDNASVATRITAFPGPNQIKVESVGRDDVLRFSNGDWIEITDDARELRNLPGELRRIRPADGVDEATKLIAFEGAAVAGIDPARNARIRRWDSPGAIQVPAAATKIPLEDGLAIEFSVAEVGGGFRSGDYWVAAARTANASFEILTNAPPLGIHHHYCRLAVVTFPNTSVDLREFWPPQFGGEPASDEPAGCGCTVCVTEEGHQSGKATIQQAIDSVAKTGGTVCIGAGIFALNSPVQIVAANSVKVVGLGWKTVLMRREAGPAVIVDSSTNISIARLLLFAGVANPATLVLRDSAWIDISECSLYGGVTAELRNTAAIGLAGTQAALTIRDNMFTSPRGVVRFADAKAGYLLSSGLTIRGNRMNCPMAAIALDGPTLHYADTRFENNLIGGCGDAAIIATGVVLPSSSLNITANTILTTGSGIVVGAGSTRISDNDISGGNKPTSKAGIAIVKGAAAQIEDLHIIGNRIGHMAGDGIVLRTPIEWAAIQRNTVDTALSGIILEENGAAEQLSVESNYLTNIASTVNEGNGAAVGIRLQKVTRADIVGNEIHRVGRTAVEGALRVGIQAIGCETIRISGNRISGIGPDGEFVGEAIGIDIISPFTRLDVTENVVRRPVDVDAKLAAGNWQALQVGTAPTDPKTMGKAVLMKTRAGTFMMYEDSATVIPETGAGEASVRGNELHSRATRISSVTVHAASFCTLAENMCIGEQAQTNDPVVAIGVPAIVTGNRVRGSTKGPALVVGSPHATVIGNVTSGAIVVNGHPLQAPFAALNALLP